MLKPSFSPYIAKKTIDWLKFWYNQNKIPILVFIMAFTLFFLGRTLAFSFGQAKLLPWDAGWYAEIMINGYTYNGDFTKQQNVVFFPLYPLLCYFISKTMNLKPHISMLLTSSVLTLFTFVFFFRILRSFCSVDISILALVLLAINPFSIFLFNGYSEAAWLFCVILFFYFLMVSHSYWNATICVILASLSRPYGILLVITFIFYTLIKYTKENGMKLNLEAKEIKALLFLVPLSFTGLMAYTGYLDVRFGDPLAFKHVLKAWGVIDYEASNLYNFLTLHFVWDNLSRLSHISIIDPQGIAAFLFLLIGVTTILFYRAIPKTLLFFSLFMQFYFYYSNYNSYSVTINMGRHLLICFPGLICICFFLHYLENLVIVWTNTLATIITGRLNPIARKHVHPILSLPVVVISSAIYLKYTYDFYCFVWIS